MRSRPQLRRFGLRSLAGSIVIASAALGSGIALAAAGDFDTGFGTGGTARSDFDGSAVADVAIQPDGKIVAVGTGETSGSPADDELAVIGRYTTGGVLDSAFAGGTGIAGGQYDTTPTKLLGVAIQPSPTAIVTAGFKEVGGSATDTVGTIAEHAGQGIFAGILNTGFAGDGVQDVIFGAGDPSRMHEIARDPANGDFVAVGQTIPSAVAAPRFGIASVTSTGAFESGFGTGGSGKLTASPSFIETGVATDDVANAVAIKADSSIVVAGNSDPATADGGANDDSHVSVQFLSATGSTGGANLIDVGDADTGADMVLQPDNKILIAGTTTTAGDSDHFLMRLLSNGDPDPTFGDGGDGIFVQSAVSGDNFGNSLVLLPDGRIVVVGFKPAGDDWVVARYTSSGLPDTTFDGDGSRLYDLTPDAGNLFAVTPQPDGKLVVGGSIAGDWAIGRLEADPPPPQVNPPVVTPTLTPTPTPVTTPAKKCKKGQKLRKGKCVKKRKKRK
jgi:uncharacterized delta-60 repeat protein